MSFIYLLALAGVALAIVFTVAEAMISVARPRAWQRPSRVALMQLVETSSRRTQTLRFVGNERRQAHREEAREGEAQRLA